MPFVLFVVVEVEVIDDVEEAEVVVIADACELLARSMYRLSSFILDPLRETRYSFKSSIPTTLLMDTIAKTAAFLTAMSGLS